MDQSRLVLAGALVVAVAALAVLLLAVGRRWFAPYKHGFLLSVMLALAGTGLAIAGVLGVWAYTENRATLVQQILTELSHIADIQQNEIREDIREAETQLQFLASHLTHAARRNPPHPGRRAGAPARAAGLRPALPAGEPDGRRGPPARRQQRGRRP